MSATAESKPFVLLVEDDPAHAELITRGFVSTDAFGELVHVADGEAALEYLFGDADEEGHAIPTPSVVLLDLRLPRIDGLEVLRSIKRAPRTATLPVVILTTSHGEEDITQAYRDRANGYLVKPSSFRQLSEMMRDFRAYWLDWNQPPL